MQNTYRVDEDRVVFEILDKEVVLVNLDNGYYYVLEGSAAAIWQFLAAGLAMEDSVDLILKNFSGDREKITAEIQNFTAELINEDLLEIADSPLNTLSKDELAKILNMISSHEFEAPAMYKYTDMANLIQMDPIREYDETGWPKKRTFPKAADK